MSLSLSNRAVWFLVLAITLAGLMFRWVNLNEKSLWTDEVATIASALGNSIDPVAWTLQGHVFDPPGLSTAAVYQARALTSHGLLNTSQTTQVLQHNVHPPFFFW